MIRNILHGPLQPIFQMDVRSAQKYSSQISRGNISNMFRGLPFHNQGGVRVFTPEYNFFFLSQWKYNFFFLSEWKFIFFLLPIRPLFYYMTEREWYYGFASAVSSASAYDFWRKHNN